MHSRLDELLASFTISVVLEHRRIYIVQNRFNLALQPVLLHAFVEIAVVSVPLHLRPVFLDHLFQINQNYFELEVNKVIEAKTNSLGNLNVVAFVDARFDILPEMFVEYLSKVLIRGITLFDFMEVL